MSLALLLIYRQSKNLTQLLRPLQFSPKIFYVELSTLKSKYPSIKPSPPFGGSQNPFREPTDDKSRRLKLQAHIRFREQFRLENDYELVYTLPRERMYGLMHLLCTCATVTMIVFIVLQFHRDMLDLEPILPNTNQEISPWIIYTMAAVVGTGFVAMLVVLSQVPIRLYYSPARRSYALFYHPVIGVFRQKKLLFKDNQYQVIPQRLDNLDSSERSMKIRIELGQGLLRMKNSFYLVEMYFRSNRDIRRIRMKDIETDETDNQTKEKEEDIWETVIEKKDQTSTKKRTFM